MSLAGLLNSCLAVLVETAKGQNGLSDIGGVRGIMEALDEVGSLVVLAFPSAEVGILAVC